MLIYSLIHLSINPFLLAYFIVAFGLGLAVTVLFALAIAMLMYTLFKNGRFGYWLLTSLQQATSYPLQIYGTFGVALFTIVVPFGVAVSYPAQILLGKLPVLPGLAVVAFELGTDRAILQLLHLGAEQQVRERRRLDPELLALPPGRMSR